MTSKSTSHPHDHHLIHERLRSRKFGRSSLLKTSPLANLSPLENRLRAVLIAKPILSHDLGATPFGLHTHAFEIFKAERLISSTQSIERAYTHTNTNTDHQLLVLHQFSLLSVKQRVSLLQLC